MTSRARRQDPGFNRTVLPYLDRGMIFVIAHIRGGGEMGRYWYEEQGKYLQKRNTFSVPTTARPVSCLHDCCLYAKTRLAQIDLIGAV